MRNRFFRIFPYTLLAFIINYIIYTYIHNIDVFQFICQKPYLIFEVSLLSMVGLNNNPNLLNAPTWNISALLIVEFVIMSLLINYRKIFLKIIIPFSIIFLIGTIANYKSTPPIRVEYNYYIWSN